MLLRFAVFFVMFLIITLPVCVAQSLEIKSFSGKDNVQGYARPDDAVRIEISALIPRDLVISVSQVQVCRAGLCSFPESCVPDVSYGRDVMYTCVFREFLDDAKGILHYSVKLFDDDRNLVREVFAEIGIDFLSPRILKFDVRPRAAKDAAVIEIDVQDYGSARGDAGYCSGVMRLDFYDEESGKVLFAKEFSQGLCDISERFAYLHKSGRKSERISFCARAVDFFGHESSPECVDFVFDAEAPIISGIGFADMAGNPVSHISSSGMNVEIFAEIDDVSELQSVTADLSGISGSPADKSRKFDYRRDNRFYWSGFYVNPGVVCSADVYAVDALGNSASAAVACDIGVDGTGPEVEQIRTNYESYAGVFVAAPDTRITARIKEEGVGLYRKQIYLDLKELGLGVLQADSCEKMSDSIWACYWNDVTPKVRDGDYQIRITDESMDDLGNKIIGKAGLDLEVYGGAARIAAVSQYPVAPDYDDVLKFTLRVANSRTEPGVFVDASGISTGSFPKQASCTGAGIGEWECYVDVGMLKKMHMREKIVFFIESGKGARQDFSQDVFVYEPEPAGGADFYAVAGVDVLPKKGFDRRLVYNIPAPVYLQPRLQQKSFNPDVSVMDVIAECSADGSVSGIYLVSGDPEKPYIVVKSSPEIAERDSPVQVDCTLSLRIKQGTRIFRSLETEFFSVSIPVYNNPLGTIGENAQVQIDAINNRVRDLEKRTKQWSDINDWVGTIVWLAQSIAAADYIMTYVGSALWLVASVLYELRSVPYFGPVLKEISRLLWKGIACGLIFTDAHTGVLQYIWNPGIVGTEVFSADFDVSAKRLMSTLIKTVSIIYSCQLCDFSSSLYSGTKSVVYGGTVFDIEGRKGAPTEIERFTVYSWDPYRSIHVAMGCLCMPGIVYNMRKEVQVNCIYRNCIEQNAELGLPFDSCQQSYKEQNCLYVDGAAWRVAGGAGIAFAVNSLLTVVLDQIPVMFAGKSWSAVCDPDCGLFGKERSEKSGDCGKYGLSPAKGSGESAYPDRCRDYPVDDWRVPFCGVWTSTMLLLETDFFGTNRYGWDKYYAELEGEDYCG